MRIVKGTLGPRVGIFVSPAHLDDSVQTGIPGDLYEEIRILRILGNRAFLQWGNIRPALAADTTVVDLNPRSVSAWFMLLLRRALRRRTLVWGHIHPQAGADAATAGVRVLMRRLASGTISYTYRDATKAFKDLPEQEVWTAPNSLYLREQIKPARSHPGGRGDVLYVGRFATAKKVDLLVRGFAEAARVEPGMRLTLIGGGAQERELKHLVQDLAIEDKVDFPGWIDDLAMLASYYESAFCSVSTGFAGLGLTQSLGFGVPMVVADGEPHSPEIELEDSGGVFYFESDSVASLSGELIARWKDRSRLPDVQISDFTKNSYSAEAMAEGLISALESRSLKEL